MLGTAATNVTQLPWKHYSFANFLLTIDPEDAKNNTYVYQDVTTLPTSAFPPKLSQVDDFFIGANQDAKGNITPELLGIPLESNPAYIISLVTGTVYNAQGVFPSLVVSSPGSLLTQLRGKVRPALRKALDMLITRQTPVKQPTPPPAPVIQLDEVTVSKLLGSLAYLPSPFTHLKRYQNKYYAVTGAANDAVNGQPASIFDYAAHPMKGPEGKEQEVGILYNGKGLPATIYSGALLDIARQKAGVVVNADGSQVLGVPHTMPGIELGDKKGVMQDYPSSIPTITLGDTTYTLKQYTNARIPGARVMALAKPSQGSSFYIDLYSGSEFDTNGHARIAEYQALEDSNHRLAAFIGNDNRGMPQNFGTDIGGYYYQYTYYMDFTSNKNPNLIYKGFNALGDADKYLAIDPADLDLAKPWVVKAGQKQQSGVIAFDPKGATYKSSAEYIKPYSYIGSRKPGSSPVFEFARATWDANYAGNLLVVAGTKKGDAFTVERLFVPAATGDSRLSSAKIPLGAYIECQGAAKGGSKLTMQAVKLPDGTTSDYQVTFDDGLVDANTGANYVAFEDTNGIHFFIPAYQSTSGKTIRDIQYKLKNYISITAFGDVGIFKPLLMTALGPVAAILNVPASAREHAQGLITSKQFVYDSDQKRYLYKYGSEDTNKIYYPGTTVGTEQPAYVDLRSGVFYDVHGIPTGGALNYPELSLLLGDKSVGIPGPVYDSVNKRLLNPDPTKLRALGGTTMVPADAVLTPTSAFLLYHSER